MRAAPVPRAAALSSTRRWVESVVIGLALCPWASPVRNSIRYTFTSTDRADVLFDTLVAEIELLEATPTTPTTILVHPHALADFDEMNAFLAETDSFIEDSGRADAFQVVRFHPDFQFAGEAADDASNWTNRSPHPMLHLLRQDDVSQAVDAHQARVDDADALSVPEANQRHLRQLGAPRLRRMVERCTHAVDSREDES